MKLSLFHRSSAFLIAALFLLAPLANTRAQEEDFPQSNAWAQATPSVLWCDDPSSTTTFEVHIVGRTDVVRVWLTDMIQYDDEGLVELFDDGTHGDDLAGDNIFSLADFMPPCNPDFVESRGGVSRRTGMLRVELSNGSRTGNNYGLTIGLVHQKFKDTFTIHNFGSGLSATAYAFFIQDSAHEVLDNYPVASLYCGTSNFAAYQKLYSVLPDAFDFALVMPGMKILRPDDLAENVPYAVMVSNHIEHIGMDIVDKTAQFGSAGRLKTAIYHSFGSIAIVDHEILHTWGAALGQSLGLLNENYEVNMGHWNELSDIHGQLSSYYFSPEGAIGHFIENGDGIWSLQPNITVEAYSPLDLYLMGLLPPEEVLPVHILQAPDTTNPAHVSAASYRTITIEEIIQAEGGPRSPDSSQSQKDFTLAFIITQDQPFNDAAYAYFSLFSMKLESKDPPMENTSFAPFYWATGGRATLTSRLPVDLPDPVFLAPAEEALPPAQADLTATATTWVPTPTATSGGSPVCPGTLAAGGLILLPGLWLLVRRRGGV